MSKKYMGSPPGGSSRFRKTRRSETCVRVFLQQQLQEARVIHSTASFIWILFLKGFVDMERNGIFNHLSTKERIYTLQYIKKEENVCGRQCGKSVNSTQFCMQKADSCSVVCHNTRRQTCRKRSKNCVSNCIYVKVTTLTTEESVDAEGARYCMDAVDEFTQREDMENLAELILNYDEDLQNCDTDTDAVRKFETFEEDADARLKECAKKLIKRENDGRHWGGVATGDRDPYKEY